MGRPDPTPGAPYDITRTCVIQYQDKLIAAAKRSDVALLEEAMMSGADPNHRDSMGSTALHYAVLHSSTGRKPGPKGSEAR